MHTCAQPRSSASYLVRVRARARVRVRIGVRVGVRVSVVQVAVGHEARRAHAVHDLLRLVRVRVRVRG